MPISTDKIKELLGNGLSNEIVATAVGVTPAYISQLMSNDDFASDVITLRTTTLAAATSRDRSWDGLEDTLLGMLADKVEQNMIYKPGDILRALQVVNNAKRRGNTAQDSLVINQAVINLSIPTIMVNNYKKNSNGEVVEVTSSEGKTTTLVTMPAQALMAKLSQQHQGSNPSYETVRRYLPRSDEEKKQS